MGRWNREGVGADAHPQGSVCQCFRPFTLPSSGAVPATNLPGTPKVIIGKGCSAPLEFEGHALIDGLSDVGLLMSLSNSIKDGLLMWSNTPPPFRSVVYTPLYPRSAWLLSAYFCVSVCLSVCVCLSYRGVSEGAPKLCFIYSK